MVSKTPKKTIDVADFPITLTFALTIATQQTAVEVTGKRSPFANSDPNYVALRNADPGAAYGVANLTLFDQLDFVLLGYRRKKDRAAVPESTSFGGSVQPVWELGQETGRPPVSTVQPIGVQGRPLSPGDREAP